MYTTRSEKLHRPGGMEGFQFHCNPECNNHVKNPKFSCNFRMTTWRYARRWVLQRRSSLHDRRSWDCYRRPKQAVRVSTVLCTVRGSICSTVCCLSIVRSGHTFKSFTQEAGRPRLNFQWYYWLHWRMGAECNFWISATWYDTWPGWFRNFLQLRERMTLGHLRSRLPPIAKKRDQQSPKVLKFLRIIMKVKKPGNNIV